MKSPLRLSPIFLLIAVAFFIGVLTLNNYGESWDELDIYRYAEYALDAYPFISHPQDLKPFDTSLNLYGPAYFMFVALLQRVVTALIPAWTVVDARHFVYFITFLASVYILYRLSKRWLREWAAFGVALLLLTQPLLWGHALINPKDMPFMTLFLAGIYLGFEMVDAPPRTFRRWVLILAAGIILGLGTSIRVIGPLAGILVVTYALIKNGRQAAVTLSAYALTSILAAYLTWPYLWHAPVANYLTSIQLMAQYPFDAKVLFWGILYPPDQLPRFYFPTFFALQLTEPFLAFFLIGLAAMTLSRKMEPILLFCGWFLFPVFMLIVTEENDPTPREKYDYALILTRKNQNENRCKKSEVAYVVERNGVIFAIVTKLGDSGFCK